MRGRQRDCPCISYARLPNFSFKQYLQQSSQESKPSKRHKHRVVTDLENLEKSGKLKETPESQGICLKSRGICDRISKVREFCCLKFIFSQVEDPNFENFLGEHAPDSLNGFGITVEINLGLEKSGNFILSGKWQPCKQTATLAVQNN